MSELKHALDLFNFSSVEDVTLQSLKNAFKTHILEAHPDKGGNSELFDEMLHSYMYLMELVQRITGGRGALTTIVSPSELKNMRPDEVINRFYEEFQNETFNKNFEENNSRDTHGYSTWLKSADGADNLTDGTYGNATQKAPTFNEAELNKQFEKTLAVNKPVSQSIILHPDSMAYVSGQILGSAIIDTSEGGYTSDIFTNPEFTDLYSAFNTDNTIYDKLPEFIDNSRDKDIYKTVEELVNERNTEITPLTDTELQAIADYEKKKIATDISNVSKIKEYFNGISHSSANNLKYESQDKYSAGFVISL